MRQLRSMAMAAALLVPLTMLGCESPPRASADAVGANPTTTPPVEGRAVIQIDGLACPFCTYNIQRQLERVAGVEQAEISLKKGEAYVTLSSQNPPTAEQLRQAVESAGFTPTKVQMP